MFALLSYLLTVAILAALENSPQVWLNAADAMVAVGLGMFLFVLILRQRQDFSKALSLLLVFQVAYGIFRSWMFAPTLSAVSQQLVPVYNNYLQRFPELNIKPEMTTWIQNFILTYQAAIWGSMQVAGAFFGSLLFQRVSRLRRPLRSIRFPYGMVFVMLAALALSLYPLTRVWGINLLVCLGMIYLIQGAAVLSHFWGDFFAKARLMRTLLICAIILNYPVLVLISFVGILDVWFDFRKLNKMEEKHESNSD